MTANLEAYLLINLLMNAMVIGLCARSVGKVRVGALLFASAFGALYATVMYLPPFQLLRVWPAKLLLTAALSAMAIRADRPRDVLFGAARLLCGSMFCAGVLTMLGSLTGREMPWLFVPVAGALLAGVLSRRERGLDRWEMRVTVVCGGERVRFTALVDTGNHLREPISALPVMVAEEPLVKGLLPEGALRECARGGLPRGFRFVQYGTVGGSGRLVCFQPDAVYALYADKWVRVRDIWIAIYPGRLPGSVRALAPPVIGRVQESARDAVEK